MVENRAQKLITKLYILLFLVVGGCALSRPQELDPKIFYKRDMRVKIEHKERLGTVVSNLKKNTYTIETQSPGNGDLYLYRTCHRETVMEGKGKKVKFKFTPLPGIEDQGNCFLEIASFEKKGRHSWAMVDFLHGRFGLPALIRCNGRQYPSIGVTICQSRAGNIMDISFYKNQTLVSDNAKCGSLKSDNGGNSYRFKMKNRICTYIFKEKGGFRLHKLTTVGYEALPVRDL